MKVHEALTDYISREVLAKNEQPLSISTSRIPTVCGKIFNRDER
jgi:hypothetical protein